MEHLLFAAYLVLFAWLVTRVKLFKDSGLTASQLIILFLLKVIAGIFYGWVGVYYGQLGQMQDTWMYHYESVKEYQILTNDPSEFFKSIFRNNYKDGYGGFLSTQNSWWNDLKGNIFIKTVALFNLLSFGNYYVNVIFYSFITMFGPVGLYRIMQTIFPKHKLAVILSTFLIPSFIYWTSGLHKEGLIFLGLVGMCYPVYFGLKEKKASILGFISVFAGFLAILMLRNFMIITVVPAFVAWILAARLKFRPSIVFTAVYIVFILLFFTAQYIHPKLNFPEAVAIRQGEFLSLGGGSAVPVSRLEPTIGSFVMNLPQAVSLAVLRPYPSDVHHLLSLAAATETNVLLLLFLLFLFVRRKNGKHLSPFLLFCIFLSFSVFIMIGYTVNILGAIVRYRSIVLPFIIVPIVAKIDWDKILAAISGNITNKNNI